MCPGVKTPGTLSRESRVGTLDLRPAALQWDLLAQLELFHLVVGRPDDPCPKPKTGAGPQNGPVDAMILRAAKMDTRGHIVRMGLWGTSKPSFVKDMCKLLVRI